MISKRKIYKLIYYSHVPLVFLAMILTGTISAVLYGQISWRVIILVGLSTHFTYSLDNLIDWNKDKHRYRDIETFIQVFHKITYILIPGSAIGIIFLIIHSPNELKIGMLLLGAAVGMSTTRFSHYRENDPYGSKSLIGFLLNRLFISLIWTTVCIFLPVWYQNLPIRLLTWHTFLYMYMLIFTYSVIWKLEKSAYPLKREIFTSFIPLFMVVLLILSLSIVIYDIHIGIAPIQNLINLTPPVASLAGVINISRHPFNLRRKISLLTLILFLLCAISAGVHLALG